MTVASEFSSPAEFRSQLVAWLGEKLDSGELTPPSDDHSLEGHIRQFARVQQALYNAGWSRYGWPEHAGGLGGPDMLRAIVGEEIVGRRLAEPGPYSMLEVLAPTMIDYASPELAAEMVPKLLSGEEQWCQGFSEPGSGSDLASLTTRAVPDPESGGERYVINGQKVWTSFAQYSHRCILLTRTGDADTPNHQAITAFFVDLDTPGITVRPLRTMHDVDEFCEVYFDDVVVDASRMLGKPGDGWRLAMDLLPYERSTCFWQRIAYLYSRFDALIGEVKSQGAAIDSDMGEAYLALHTLRCRSRATQHRLAEGRKLGPDTSIDKVLLASAEQRLYDTARDLLPGAIELDDTEWRTEYLYSRAATIYGGTAEVQRNIIARRLLDLGEGVTMAGEMEQDSFDLLEDGLRKTMLSKSGPELDAALTELGWADMLSDMPDVAVPMVFRLLGETGSHASVLVDVVLHATGNTIGDTVELPLPYAGNSWVVWDRISPESIDPTLGGLPLRREEEGYPIRVAEARVAVGWWLVGSARAMLSLARQHALDRVQFGRPIASFQAIRHRLAETLVAIEGAEATLTLPGADNPDLTALLAKAAAGKAALTAAKNCQQVLGGIGFTAEHDLHHHVKRALVLDGLLGSSRELTRRAGAGLRARGSAPRLAQL